MAHLLRILSWRIPLIVCLAMIVSMQVAGCELGKNPPKPNTETPVLPDMGPAISNVKDASKQTNDIGKKVDDSATTIEKHTTDIEKNTPETSKPVIQPSIDGIRGETKELKDSSNELKLVSDRLKDAETKLSNEKSNVDKWVKYAGKADDQISALQKKLDDAQSENNEMFKKAMLYLVVICVIGLGVCSVLIFWLQNKTAVMVAIGFATTMAIALGVSFYMKAIAVVAISVLGVAFLGVLGYMAYQLFLTKKIEEELVQTNEITKQQLEPAARERLYGYGAEPGKIDLVQSKATKARVKEIRSYNNVNKGKVRLAPSVPEFWRPPDTHRPPMDPYGTGRHIDPYGMGRGYTDPYTGR